MLLNPDLVSRSYTGYRLVVATPSVVVTIIVIVVSPVIITVAPVVAVPLHQRMIGRGVIFTEQQTR